MKISVLLDMLGLNFYAYSDIFLFSSSQLFFGCIVTWLLFSVQELLFVA